MVKSEKTSFTCYAFMQKKRFYAFTQQKRFYS